MGRKKKILPLLHNVEIKTVAAEGKALARVKMTPEAENEIVVFVPYAAPGDIVDLKIDRHKRSYAEGHVESLVKPSDMRVEPVCEYFTVCGGCKWQHLDYGRQLEFKRRQVVDALERIGKVEFGEVNPTLGSEEIYAYRNKMEYTFSHKKWRTWEEVKSGVDFQGSSNALGFHIPGAFDKVLHIEQCHLQDNIGNEIRNAIFDFAEKHDYTFYNIKENEGDLRTLMIRIASTGEIMVCLVFGNDDEQKIRPMMQILEEGFPQITSLIYVVNQKLNDTIGDLPLHVFKGREYIEEQMEGLKFRVNAKSFYQTNSRQAYRLYSVARRFAGLDTPIEGAKPVVYDLYTGAGTIANFVARNAEKVVGIEYVPEAIEDAKLNSEINGINNTLFYAGDMKDILTADFIAEHGQPDIMIIDPPRAGMHPDVVETILNAAPQVLVYVSCNPATQARDLALLDAKYRITDVQPVDMFPHTHHVENVVRLELRD